MDMIEPGMWIQVRSFKHDGSLHRSWDQGLVLEVNDDFIITASKKTRVTESDGENQQLLFFLKSIGITSLQC